MRLHFMVPEVLIDLWHTDGQAFIMAHAEQRRPRKSWAWHDRGGQSHLLVMCLKGKSASQLFTELNLGAGWGDCHVIHDKDTSRLEAKLAIRLMELLFLEFDLILVFHF